MSSSRFCGFLLTQLSCWDRTNGPVDVWAPLVLQQVPVRGGKYLWVAPCIKRIPVNRAIVTTSHGPRTTTGMAMIGRVAAVLPGKVITKRSRATRRTTIKRPPIQNTTRYANNGAAPWAVSIIAHPGRIPKNSDRDIVLRPLEIAEPHRTKDRWAAIATRR